MTVALITGSARGLGLAMAQRLALDGHVVVLHGRDAATVKAAAADVTRTGGTAMAVTAELRDDEQVAEMIARIEAAHGGVDILVNNAMQRAYAPVAEMTPEAWEAVLAVALTGAFNCVRHVVRGMMEREWGRIVSVSGISGQRGGPMHVAVSTAKAGLIGMTKALAQELGPHGITVNALSPARIASGRAVPTNEHARQNHERIHDASTIPVRRLGDVSEVAAACSYLCSEAAAYVTGHVLALNGGLYM